MWYVDVSAFAQWDLMENMLAFSDTHDSAGVHTHEGVQVHSAKKKNHKAQVFTKHEVSKSTGNVLWELNI